MLLTRLRRITRDGHWIPEIDGLRFIAIASVFLFHLYTELSAHTAGASVPVFFLPIMNGARGVPLFFTISGLVLALPFARHFLADGQSVSLRKYYLRRITRIEPPYIFCLLGCTLLYAAYHHGFTGMLPHLAASLFYLHDAIYAAPSQVNGVLWSLEIEVQFYLIAPLLMQIFRLRNAIARRGILIAAILLWIYAQPLLLHTVRMCFTLLGSLPYFLVGMLVADLSVSHPQIKQFGSLWDIAGLIALAAIFLGPYGADSPNYLLPAATFFLCMAALRGALLRRLLSAPWIAVTGGMCYSIYLWHLKLIDGFLLVTRHCILPQASFTENYLLQIVVTGIPVLLLCTLFYIAIERPCMDPAWPSKLWHAITKRRATEANSLDSSGVS